MSLKYAVTKQYHRREEVTLCQKCDYAYHDKHITTVPHKSGEYWVDMKPIIKNYRETKYKDCPKHYRLFLDNFIADQMEQLRSQRKRRSG